MSLEGNTNCQQLHKVQEVISHCFSLLKGTLFIELIATFHFHCKKKHCQRELGETEFRNSAHSSSSQHV